MSSGVNPTDSITTESVGEFNVLRSESQVMHDSALRQAVKEVIDEYAVTDAWTQKELRFEIKCPSGQKCLARRLTTLDLVESELLDEIDYFSRKLLPAKVDDAGNPIDEEETGSFSKVLQDPTKRARLFKLLDGLLHVGIVKPKIHLIPKELKAERYTAWEGPPLPKGEVWANRIDFADKMFIFGELNKPLDEINTFRLESETGLANLAAVESISGETE